jgi:hypothetical protein
VVDLADDIEAVKAETSAERIAQMLYGRLIDGVTIFGSEKMRKLIMASDRQGLIKYLALNEPGEIVAALLDLPLDHGCEIVRQLQEGLGGG